MEVKAYSAAEGWREITLKPGFPWVVIDSRPDGTRRVLQLSDAEFAAEFEPSGQAWDESRCDALLAWARNQLHRFSVTADYLRSNSADLDRPPWKDPILRAERERITALVTASGRPYDQTFDPEQPDRTLVTPPSPAAFRVTADLAAVLRVLLETPGERIRTDEIRARSGLERKAMRALVRLQEAQWVERHTDDPGQTDSWQWWLTETGLELARKRLRRRSNNDGATS